MRDKGTSVHDQFLQLDIARSYKKRKARLHAQVTLPSLVPESSVTTNGAQYQPKSEELESYPHSSLAARGMVQLASKLTASILPATNQPFVSVTLRPSDIASIKDNEEAMKLYSNAAKLIQDEVWHAITTSNLREAMFLNMKYLQVVGDGMIRQTGMEFESHRFDNYVVVRDMKGLPMYAIVRQYAKLTDLPESIRTQAEESGAGSVQRQDGTLYPLYTELVRLEDKSWESQQFAGDIPIPDTELTYGEGELPYYFSRWSFDPHDNYGISLVEENYGDLLSASAVRATLLDGYSVATSGFIGLRPGSLTPEMVAKAQNWDVLSFEIEDQLRFIQPDNIQALTAAESMDQRLSNEIRRIFLMDTSTELTHDRTTATQVIMASEELNRATGGLLSTHDRSTMKPMIMNTLKHLVDEGVFSDEINELIKSGDIIIDVKTGVDALGRESQARNVINFIAEMSQIIPGALEMLDPIQLMRWMAQAKGIPSEILKTEDKMAADQRAALQQQVNEKLAEAIPGTAQAVATQNLTQ